jgi:hypothetical protein
MLGVNQASGLASKMCGPTVGAFWSLASVTNLLMTAPLTTVTSHLVGRWIESSYPFKTKDLDTV